MARRNPAGPPAEAEAKAPTEESAAAEGAVGEATEAEDGTTSEAEGAAIEAEEAPAGEAAAEEPRQHPRHSGGDQRPLAVKTETLLPEAAAEELRGNTCGSSANSDRGGTSSRPTRGPAAEEPVETPAEPAPTEPAKFRRRMRRRATHDEKQDH